MTGARQKAVQPSERQATCDLLVHPIGELVTPVVKSGPAYGDVMGKVSRIKNAAVAIKDGQILSAGPADDVLQSVGCDTKTVRIDASRKLVTPGLVDPHTHLIFGGNRANEFIMRCQGKTYTEIAEAGGGIVASMSATRKASIDELTDLGAKRLQRMLEFGTTTCEVKTGYGLSTESELAMLKAIYGLKSRAVVDVVPTFMPAHAIPPGEDRAVYVERVITEMLPAAAEFCRRENHSLPFVDVFCDRGYFTADDTRQIFEAAKKLGFRNKVHADEFVNLGATKLATEYACASADHLLNISDAEIDLLAKSKTVAVLLPGTSFFLNLDEHARARTMIERGVAVALGSDFNPGSCHIFSLPLIWGLACLKLKLTPEEALSALTVNAAHAVGMGSVVGQVVAGYQADITVYDVASLEEVPYNLGWNPISAVIKKGVLNFSR